MRTSTLLPLVALAALCFMTACGLSAQNRPFLVGSWPANGEVVEGALPFVRLTYNEPVTFLNPADIRVHVNGGFTGVAVTQFTDEPENVYLFAIGRTAFPSDAAISVRLIQGFVINAAQHYADEEFHVAFESGETASLPVGEAGQVSLVDCITGNTLETVPTPGGQDPVGVLSTTVGGTRRIWVQLASGGGTGASLAWFEPGDAGMTAITLSNAGSDLTSSASALAVGPFGGELYVAYRDTSTEVVRVFLIDTVLATEVTAIDLDSIPGGAATTPTGLALREGTSVARFHVTADDGAMGTVAAIERATFTEVDFDDGLLGTQGIALLGGGGPTAAPGGTVVVGTAGGSDVDVVPPGGPAETSVGTVPGTNATLVRAPDGAITLQGLAGYTGLEGLQQRTRGSAFDDPTAIEVSDDLGGVSQAATDVLGISFFASGDRFLVLLDSPGGTLLTEWTYANGGTLEQVDLDEGTDGIQAIPLSVTPIVVGTNSGAFP